jgi:hypothetical protein
VSSKQGCEKRSRLRYVRNRPELSSGRSPMARGLAFSLGLAPGRHPRIGWAIRAAAGLVGHEPRATAQAAGNGSNLAEEIMISSSPDFYQRSRWRFCRASSRGRSQSRDRTPVRSTQGVLGWGSVFPETETTKRPSRIVRAQPSTRCADRVQKSLDPHPFAQSRIHVLPHQEVPAPYRF